MLFNRRLRFTILVLAAQLLLLALAVSWLVHMVLIAKNGKVYFVESNPVVLYGEIAATAMITIFAIIIFVLQLKRLGERRREDSRER